MAFNFSNIISDNITVTYPTLPPLSIEYLVVAGGGGGGAGGIGQNQVGESGVANTGGGAGAGGGGDDANFGAVGGTGGSGIVIIKYADSLTGTFTPGLTVSTSNSGGYKISCVTAGTGCVSFS